MLRSKVRIFPIPPEVPLRKWPKGHFSYFWTGFASPSCLRTEGYFGNEIAHCGNECIPRVGRGHRLGGPSCQFSWSPIADLGMTCGVCGCAPALLGGEAPRCKKAQSAAQKRMHSGLGVTNSQVLFSNFDQGEYVNAASVVKSTTDSGVGFDPVIVSVAEAAKLAGCSDDTIRRRLRAGRLPNAYQEGVGDGSPWRIPVADLIEEGLCAPGILEQLDERLNPNVAHIANQLVDLRAELLAERTRRETAEQLHMSARAEVEYLRQTLNLALERSLGVAGDR